MTHYCLSEFPRDLEVEGGQIVRPLCQLEQGHEGAHESAESYGPLHWPNPATRKELSCRAQ